MNVTKLRLKPASAGTAASRPMLLPLTLLTAACLTSVAHATGVHNSVPALLTYSPQMPHVGQRWQVQVSLQSPDPTAVHPARRVWLVGEMTGHPMRPVEAELTRADMAGNMYAGALEFTMRGPWRVTVRVEELIDVVEGSLALDVVGDDESTGLDALRDAVLLQRPDQPTMVPPAWTLGGAVVLALALEWIVARYHRRRYVF